MQAARPLEKGYSESEVARRVGAHRQSVSQWAAGLREKGRAGLKKAGRAGRKPRLSPQQLREDRARAQAGPRGAGLRNQSVDLGAGGAFNPTGMRDCVPSRPRVAHPAAVGMELSASGGAGAGAGQSQDSAVEAEALAGVKKKAKNEGRTIVFIDESGLSERPHRCRTWAPRGQTPVLQYHFNWKTLSAIAGVTWWNFYFRLFPGAIRSPQIIQFLAHLSRHIPGKLLIIWDGLKGHGRRKVWEYLQQQRGRLWLEYLPGYAPELNPVEYLWSHWKQHELPNFCPQDFGQLSVQARRALQRHSSSAHAGLRLLGASGTLSLVTILCEFNKSIWFS